MIAALAAIREGRGAEQAVAWLNERCAGPHRNEATPLLLTSRRDAAARHNEGGMRTLSTKGVQSMTFNGAILGSFGEDVRRLPAEANLELHEGARVMALKNDQAGQYVNGSLGTVVRFIDDDDPRVVVRFDAPARPRVGDALRPAGSKDPFEIEIRRAVWTKTRQVWNEEDGVIEDIVTGSYEQIPLAVGYAITIHKAQGLSLADVRIDLGAGAFAPGQLYVGLSRARSVEGLSFAQPLRMDDVRVDPMLIQFLDWAQKSKNLTFEGKGMAAMPSA